MSQAKKKTNQPKNKPVPITAADYRRKIYPASGVEANPEVLGAVKEAQDKSKQQAAVDSKAVSVGLLGIVQGQKEAAAQRALFEKGRESTEKATDKRKEQAAARHKEWLRLAHEELKNNLSIKTFGALAKKVRKETVFFVLVRGQEEKPTSRAIYEYLRTVPAIRKIIKK